MAVAARTAGSSTPATAAKPVASPKAILALVFVGYSLASWAMNPVSSILPTISSDLRIDVTRAAWVVNVYFVLLVGWVLTAGKLGDAVGHGRVFRTGCLIFCVGSAVCWLPGGLAAVLIGRAIQGVGSAMIFGTSLAIITSAYDGPQVSLGHRHGKYGDERLIYCRGTD